jgi:hypothetical protein
VKRLALSGHVARVDRCPLSGGFCCKTLVETTDDP